MNLILDLEHSGKRQDVKGVALNLCALLIRLFHLQAMFAQSLRTMATQFPAFSYFSDIA
jgi:ABC-type uncharacterized transport system permease subunit